MAFSSSLKLREKLSLGQTWFQYGGRRNDRQPCRRALLSTWWVAGGPRTLILVVLCLYRVDDLGWPGPVTFVPKHFSFLVRTCGFLLHLNLKWCAACCEWAERVAALLFFAFVDIIILFMICDFICARIHQRNDMRKEKLFSKMVSTISDHVCDRQHWRRNLHRFP